MNDQSIWKRLVAFLLGCCMLSLMNCGEKPTQSHNLTPFELWKSLNLHDYSVDQTHWCFCPQGGEVMRITVRSDTVASVYKISERLYVAYPLSTYYLTIDSLFSIIQNRTTDSIVVAYNSIYGFPESLDINPQWHPVDGGILFLNSNFQIP